MKCQVCGSENMSPVHSTEHGITLCMDCSHTHIGGVAYHDRWCCDMVFRKGGGARGSTEASRSRHAEALEAREAASKAPPAGE